MLCFYDTQNWFDGMSIMKKETFVLSRHRSEWRYFHIFMWYSRVEEKELLLSLQMYCSFILFFCFVKLLWCNLLWNSWNFSMFLGEPYLPFNDLFYLAGKHEKLKSDLHFAIEVFFFFVKTITSGFFGINRYYF